MCCCHLQALPSLPRWVCRAEAVNGPISVNTPATSLPDPITAATDGKASKPVDRSKGLWTRCDKCGVILYIKHLKVRSSGVWGSRWSTVPCGHADDAAFSPPCSALH